MTAPPRPARSARFPLAIERVRGATPAAARPGTVLLRPQQLLQVAADHADAERRGAPSGLGLDSSGVRARMVQRLRDGGVRSEPVLAAFAAVPRHHFVDSALAAQAYEDTSLPIGLQQTISKPSVVATMLALAFDSEAARARGSLGRVLEIGTGCGYQTALLSLLATSVKSIERLKPLHERALELLAPLRRHNLRLLYGDGCLGHAPNAPYDTIIAAAGGDELPPAWLAQLAPGGRIVAPMLSPRGQGQALLSVERIGENDWRRQFHEGVHFVPLKSGVA